MRHDACPVSQRSSPNRRQVLLDACRATSRRPSPKSQPRRPITVYECDGCGNRALGEQRCPDCSTFMRKIGIGGECPCCDEPISVTELVSQEVIATQLNYNHPRPCQPPSTKWGKSMIGSGEFPVS